MKKIKFLNLKSLNNKILNRNKKFFFNILKKGIYSNHTEVKKFEKNYAKHENFKYCIALNSGTSALHLAIESLKLKKNSTILVPSHTFLATISAIEYAGHRPRFVDINKDTLNIDINTLKKMELKKIKAIIAVDMHGNKCEIEEIYKICNRNNIKLIQDSSQSHGVKTDKKLKKNFLKCQSFYPTKNLGSIGEGGCVLTNDKRFYKRIIEMRNWGKQNFIMINKGYNCRMTELNAAFLRIKLKEIKTMSLKKIKLANIYIKKLKKLISSNDIRLQKPNGLNHVYHHFILRVSKSLRNKLKIFLNNKKIETAQHYLIPCHKEKYFVKKFNIKNIKLTETERLYSEMISLPCDFSHNVIEIKKVANSIKKFFIINANQK